MKKILNLCLIGLVATISGCMKINENNLSINQNSQKSQDYIADYIDTMKNKEMWTMPSMNWESHSTYKVVYASDNFASFEIKAWSYTGGAHGMTTTIVGTVKDGEILKIKDLPEDVKNLWAKEIDKYFQKQGWRKNSYMTENFYIDDKGIHFIYDPYEIDCYAAGTIDIFVPYNFK